MVVDVDEVLGALVSDMDDIFDVTNNLRTALRILSEEVIPTGATTRKLIDVERILPLVHCRARRHGHIFHKE